MLEMLKERKAALEAQGKKGFTLMEMLIVIAIIAILIAIAIPLFTSQLNAAKQATDESNARALYAQVQANYMLNSSSNSWKKDDLATLPYTGAASGTTTYDGTTYKWSDKLNSLTVSATGASGAPVVVVKTNDVESTFGTPAS